ncbi:hypothetical protein JCM19235_4442 [Vibrio maritimus]|uniref:Uncharacterized protein n=1 Tax=Vibrio maritimus TaxID=990268 RepID=A0A090SLG0_9VIBR|nr:hypothetical protein JCM19235_4442 [Vibrio maritimus]
MKAFHFTLLAASIVAGSAVAATGSELATQYKLDPSKAPAQNFDMTNWKINLPVLTTEGPRKVKHSRLQKSSLAIRRHLMFIQNGSIPIKSPARWSL